MVKKNQNIFDFTLENFGTLENLFDDVLVPNSIKLDNEIKTNQEININTAGKGDDDIKGKIQEQGLVFTNNDITAPDNYIFEDEENYIFEDGNNYIFE